MENLIYWCAGFFVGYLLVRGIRTLWSGGFVFLLCSGLSVQGATYFTFYNDTGGAVSIGGGGKLVSQKNSASGVGFTTEYGADGDIPAGHTFVSGVATSFSPGDTWKIYFKYPGNVTGDPSEIIKTGTYATDFNLTGGPGGEPIYTAAIPLSGVPLSEYAQYIAFDFKYCNDTLNTIDVGFVFRLRETGPCGNEGDEVFSFLGRLKPGDCYEAPYDFDCPVWMYVVKPGNELNDYEWGVEELVGTNTPAGTTTTTPNTNVVFSLDRNPGTNDLFADIPLREDLGTNTIARDRQNAEGVVKAVAEGSDNTVKSIMGGSVAGSGKSLADIYGALTNGFGDGNGDSNAIEYLRVIATNTTTLSNMVINATNLSGFQGMAAGASNTALGLFAATNSMGGAFQSISNNTESTDLFSPGARAPTASLTIAIGSVGGNDYSINLDPNQTGTWLSEKLTILWDLLSFTKKFAAMVVFIALFWAMYNHVEQYSIQVIQNAGRIAKLPSVGLSDIVGRAAFGVFLSQVLTVIIGILPWTAFAVMSLYFNTAPASSVPNIDVETQAGIDLTGVLKETFLRYFWAMAHGIPFAEMLSAFIQYAAFRFYMPWLFGLVITLIDTYAIMVVGRCILPFLFVVGSSGAQIELHNLTGTNLLWTNSTRLIQFPPGETRIDIESGWYLTNGSEVPLPETENIQVLRFSFDPDGSLAFDYGFATSPADYFWYGLAAGLSIFGTLAFVSVIKAGIGVGTRNNVWVPD